MSDAEVVIYGAGGYTGKHVAWKLAQRGIPFIAAGRNGKRLREQLGARPELAGADYECIEVEHTEAALSKLLDGKKIIHNLVGPFMQLGEPVVKAALNCGCHYLDATGEQDWMIYLREHYAHAFKQQGLVLSPACASMWNSGYMAAELCLEAEGIDSVDIVYALRGVPSVSSTLSFMRMCCQPQYYLENNHLTQWQAATAYDIAIPGVHRIYQALPWSGGGESIWYRDDPRVINCSTLVTFMNPGLMTMLVARMTEFNEKCRDLPQADQEQATNAWAMEIAPRGEPPPEDLEVHRNLISCHGRGRLGCARIELYGVTGYVLTGAIGAITIAALLDGKANGTGFLPAARLTGYRSMLDELAREGVYCRADAAVRK
jgi:hypothetical protein